jgi:hypothetical protein
MNSSDEKSKLVYGGFLESFVHGHPWTIPKTI